MNSTSMAALRFLSTGVQSPRKINQVKTAAEIKLKVSYYSKEEKITVPVDLAVGLGAVWVVRRTT